MKRQGDVNLVFAPDVVLQVIGDEALILKLNDERVFSLNSTAARIAQLIAERFDVDGIAERLALEYGQDPAVVRHEVELVATWLMERGLLVDPMKDQR